MENQNILIVNASDTEKASFYKKTYKHLALAVLAFIVVETILINVVFIPEYGFYACAWATLVVYAFQMIASYYLGQRYYPIQYNLRKFFLYFGGALILYFAAKVMQIDGLYTRLIFHNLLIIIYLAIVFTVEKITLKRI